MPKKTKSVKLYKPGQIGMFANAICTEYKLDPAEVSAFLLKTFPQLRKKEKCVNCGASMAIYNFAVTSLDALLLVQMGKIVMERCKKGMLFRDANKIHLSTSIKGTNSSRQTISSKLGLITKVKKSDGSHDRRAGWLITKRGFDFLAGRPIPAKVQVFRNEITERFDELTTLGQVASTDTYLGQEIKGKDFAELEHYSIVGFSQGTLL